MGEDGKTGTEVVREATEKGGLRGQEPQCSAAPSRDGVGGKRGDSVTVVCQCTVWTPPPSLPACAGNASCSNCIFHLLCSDTLTSGALLLLEGLPLSGLVNS